MQSDYTSKPNEYITPFLPTLACSVSVINLYANDFMFMMLDPRARNLKQDIVMKPSIGNRVSSIKLGRFEATNTSVPKSYLI